MARPRTVEDLLGEARRRLRRLEPWEAYAAMQRGALLVDIRDGDQRRSQGVVPGSLHIPRNVLEWRVDPASGYQHPAIAGVRGQLILLCAEGYSSSLAAATLVDIGIEATDVVGGFAAWKAAGLPIGEEAENDRHRHEQARGSSRSRSRARLSRRAAGLRQEVGRLSELLSDLHLLLTAPPEDARALYGRLAPRYDRLRAHWLKLAGAPAEQAILADLAAMLKPGQRVLDAGCGTGALSRQVHALQPEARITMLDLSPAMLARARDVPGEHVLANVLALPFPDGHFDLVLSAWVLETVAEPERAVREWLRVLVPGGTLLYTFCSLPEGVLERAASASLRASFKRSFAVDFLSLGEPPCQGCEGSHERHFRAGLTAAVALRKCCAA